MIPYELKLCNFMCYRGEQPALQFDGLHIACLSGENGAGKSAILDALTWVLWGEARISSDNLISQGETEMWVELQFALNAHGEQQQYRVIRRRQLAGKRGSGKSWLDLQLQGEKAWRPIGEKTIAETQQLIDNLLRMKYATFVNASFLLQGRADEFTRKTPGERKQVLVDILDLESYALLAEQAKQRAKKIGDQLRGLESLIAYLQEEANKVQLYDQFVSEVQERVSKLTAELQKVEEEKQQVEKELQQLELKASQRKELAARLITLRKDQFTQQQEIANLQETSLKAEKMLQQREEIAAGVVALVAAQEELNWLEELRPHYELLQEKLNDLREQFKDARRALQSELDVFKHEVNYLTQRIAGQAQIQQKLLESEQHLAEFALLSSKQQLLQAQKTELEEYFYQISDLVQQIKQKWDLLVNDKRNCESELVQLQKELQNVSRWQADLKTALEQQTKANDLATELVELREQKQQKNNELAASQALISQLKQQIAQVEQRKSLLVDSSLTTCPLCQSNLGQDGLTTISTHYEQESQALIEQIEATERKTSELETNCKQLAQAEQALETRLTQARQAAARVDLLQQNLAQAEGWFERQQQVQTKLNSVLQQLETEDYERSAREELTKIEIALDKFDFTAESLAFQPATHSIHSFLAPFEQKRKAFQQEGTALEQQLAARTTWESQAATCRQQLSEIAQAQAKLPVKQDQATILALQLDKNDFALDILAEGKKIAAEVANLGYTPTDYQAARATVQQLSHWAAKERETQEAQNRLTTSQQILQLKTELLARSTTETEQILERMNFLDQELQKLSFVEQQARELTQALNSSQRQLRVAQNDLAEKTALRAKAQKAATELAEKQEELQLLTKKQSVFQELAEAYGKKGIQAMLIELAIPEIEREANDLLGCLTDNQMHVNFKMQRETKKGDSIETLEIEIGDSIGTRNYEAFSGGEAMRINFAIRIALSRLLARRSGASLETLVIDEGFGALDNEGKERFVEAITTIQQDFKRILVITHLDELKDRFPHRIEVTKNAKGSTWELR